MLQQQQTCVLLQIQAWPVVSKSVFICRIGGNTPSKGTSIIPPKDSGRPRHSRSPCGPPADSSGPVAELLHHHKLWRVVCMLVADNG